MRVIKQGEERQDDWTLPGTEATEGTRLILPLPEWRERSPDAGPSPYGLLLTTADRVEEVLAAALRSPLVAIEFTDFNDGRGYSLARQLRAAGYAGDVRAVGEVLRDQAFYLARCGFSSFAPAPRVSGAAFIAGLEDFSLAYQAAADQRTIVQRLRRAR